MKKMKQGLFSLMLALFCLALSAPGAAAASRQTEKRIRRIPEPEIPAFFSGGANSLAGQGSLSQVDIPEAGPTMHEEQFTAYAYCACKKCCGKWARGITASGTTAQQGRTIAVDPKVIPLGTHVFVNGQEYIAEDTGSGINNRTIDIFFNSHQAALQWGKRTVTVRWPAS